MEKRTLTVTIERDGWAALRDAARRGFTASRYCGERLNFETPELFFGRLTERRWAIASALLGQGELGLRELARRLGRDVRRVHEDVTILAELGLIERTDRGGVVCPYDDIHVDMHIRHAA